MIYRTTKQIPEKLSVIGFGCWSTAAYNWSDASTVDSVRAIETAIDCGINYFDVAPVYGYGESEVLLGKAIRGKRNQVFIGTKCGLRWAEKDGPTTTDLSRKSIFEEVELSLKRLDIDCIDLYQMHWPDANISIDESMDALNRLVEQGKIRYIGASNFSVAECRQAAKTAPIASHQGLYNLFDRNSESYCGIPLEYRTEDEVLPYCKEQGMAFIPYSPLCQGVLSGKFFKGRDKQLKATDMRLSNPEIIGEALDHKLLIVEKLQKLAEESGYTLLEISLGWLIANPVVTSIIVGSRTPAYSISSAAAGDVVLSQEILTRIDEIFTN